MGRLLEMKTLGYGSEGEVKYSVKYPQGDGHVVTITAEERETLKTDNYYLEKYRIGGEHKAIIAGEQREKAVGREDRETYLKDLRDQRKAAQERVIKRDVLREEWEEKNKKGKPFWTKLRMHNPYYEPPTVDTSGEG